MKHSLLICLLFFAFPAHAQWRDGGFGVNFPQRAETSVSENARRMGMTPFEYAFPNYGKMSIIQETNTQDFSSSSYVETGGYCATTSKTCELQRATPLNKPCSCGRQHGIVVEPK